MKNLIVSLIRREIYLIETYLTPIALIIARAYIGRAFWRPGQTKISGVDSATQLFQMEYIPDSVDYYLRRKFLKAS